MDVGMFTLVDPALHWCNCSARVSSRCTGWCAQRRNPMRWVIFYIFPVNSWLMVVSLSRNVLSGSLGFVTLLEASSDRSAPLPIALAQLSHTHPAPT